MTTHHIYTKQHHQYQATDSTLHQTHTEMNSRTSGPNAEIAEGIASLQKKNAKLERMMVKIGTKTDNHEFRDKMTEEQKSAAQLCKTLMNQMKLNSGANKQVMSKLASQFDKEWKKYQALVHDMDQKMKQVLHTVSHQDEENPRTQDEDDVYRVAQLQQQDLDIQFLQYDADEIAQRHQEIRALESDVNEVAEMYKDLQAMVNEQQESIDTIENNIVATRDKTEAAAQELLQAESYQKKARRKKCCVVCILLTVVVAIVVVVVLLKK